MNLRQIRRRTPEYLVLLLEEPVPTHQFTNLRILAPGSRLLLPAGQRHVCQHQRPISTLLISRYQDRDTPRVAWHLPAPTRRHLT